MTVPKYNKYSAFFDSFNDPKAAFNYEKEQLYNTIEEIQNNSLKGKTNFTGKILESPVENKSGNTTAASAAAGGKKILFAKVRLDDVEEQFVPDPNSSPDPNFRKRIISQHKTALFSPSEGNNTVIFAPGDVVECNFSISGPNDAGKLRGLSFTDNVISREPGNFVYSSVGSISTRFDSSNPNLIGQISVQQMSSSLGTNQAKFYTPANRKPGDIKFIVLHSTDGSDKKGSAQRTIDRFAYGPTISYKDPNTGKTNPPCTDYPNGIPHGTICHPTRKQVEKPVKTSIHWAVDGHGGVIQGLLEKDIGHHSGGKKNKTSIGIEMCGKPNEKVAEGYQGKFSGMYNETMLVNTAKLVAGICKRWNLSPNRDTIIGHYEIDPDRRSDPGNDPGEWDWDVFLSLVKQFL